MIKCLKCGQVSMAVPDPDACPSCGANFAKLEQAALARSKGPASRAPGSRASRYGGATQPQRPFIETLRAESVYPSFRSVLRISLRLGLLAVVILVLAGLVQGQSALLTIGAGLLLGLLLKVSHDAVVMVADLSDAAVRLAEHQHRQDD